MAFIAVAAPVASSNQSIYFPGEDNQDGRVRVDLSGDPPVNLGAGDMTFDCWIRPSATASDNNRSGGGVNSNIFMDRDRLAPNLGSFGLGLNAGVISTWLDRSGAAPTALEAASGTTDLRDGAWHHIRYQRDQSTGQIEVWVDGSREINETGPVGGSVEYAFISGEGTYDPYLVYGAEKHGFSGFSFNGHMTECAWFNALLSSGATITVPTARWANDATNLVCVHHFQEASGSDIVDSVSGNQSPGTLITTGGAARATLSPFS